MYYIWLESKLFYEEIFHLLFLKKRFQQEYAKAHFRIYFRRAAKKFVFIIDHNKVNPTF